MSFLLDTDICSAHFRRPGGLAHRFIQHSGRIAIPTIVLAELHAWSYSRADPAPLQTAIRDLLQDVDVLPFDAACAERFGQLRAELRRQGHPVQDMDLMIASVALAHDLTLVTHNGSDFQFIPDLRLDDWVAS